MELLLVVVIVSVVFKCQVRRRAGSRRLVMVVSRGVVVVAGITVGAVATALSLHVEGSCTERLHARVRLGHSQRLEGLLGQLERLHVHRGRISFQSE